MCQYESVIIIFRPNHFEPRGQPPGLDFDILRKYICFFLIFPKGRFALFILKARARALTARRAVSPFLFSKPGPGL
jgi:hypothetical protein